MANFSEKEERRQTAKRLLQALKDAGIPAKQAAKYIGIAGASVSGWRNDKAPRFPELENLHKLAEFVAKNGISQPKVSYQSAIYSPGELTDRPPGAISLPSRANGIPVVSWAKAGEGGNFGDLEDQIDERITQECKDPNAYALIIEGDSMEPEIRPGDRVVFLPNSHPQNGDRVVARLSNCGSVLFKLYHTTGKRNEIVRLTSYNPAYPPLEYHAKDFRFIHPMDFLIRKNRR